MHNKKISIRITDSFLTLATLLSLATMVGLAIVDSAGSSQRSQDGTLDHLVLGVAQDGNVFLEVPIKPALYGPVKSAPDWQYLVSDKGEARDERENPRSQFFIQLFRRQNFETQPIPNPLSCYFHWLPPAVHHGGVS